jgi:hypothetical protein
VPCLLFLGTSLQVVPLFGEKRPSGKAFTDFESGYRGAEALRHPKLGSRERWINVNGGGQECPPYMRFFLT